MSNVTKGLSNYPVLSVILSWQDPLEVTVSKFILDWECTYRVGIEEEIEVWWYKMNCRGTPTKRFGRGEGKHKMKDHFTVVVNGSTNPVFEFSGWVEEKKRESMGR